MLRRVGVSSIAAAQCSIRPFWDPTGPQREAAFMDEKDLEQMYPVTKPETTAGNFGYSRPIDWQTFSIPMPNVRFPHLRRMLNPVKAKVVVVYGASGYVGSQIVRELCEHPHIEKVRATTRYPTLIPKGSDLDLLLQKYPEKIDLHECDVTDRIQVNVAANGADTVIFAVDYHSEYAQNSHFDVFVTGAINVSWTAKCVRAERAIFMNGLDATFASEANYVDMRARGEDAFSANFPDACIIRTGPLYGESPGCSYRYRGLGRYIYPAIWPNTRVQPTWVVDAARAAVRACGSDRAIRHRLDLGGPETMTHLQLWRQYAEEFKPRFVFPFYRGPVRFFSRLLPWICPNPWFDDNWVLTYELAQVNRRQTLFDRLQSWDYIGYVPHTVAQAAKITRGELELKKMHELDAEWAKVELQDREDFKQEEHMAKALGIHRAKAEPGMGRGEGMEMLAQEIYPGGQFRMKPLDAKYPSTVKTPHPVTN